MNLVWVKIVPLTLALALLAPAVAGAADRAAKGNEIGKALHRSYDLIEAEKYAEAKELLDQILAKDPGNPLALNNLAAVMVAEKNYDRASALLDQALPQARGYQVRVNTVCGVGKVCMAYKPAAAGMNPEAQPNKKTEVMDIVQDLEPLIKMNKEMVQGLQASPR
jgi:tetratricopeptide (TPR) repeat protein